MDIIEGIVESSPEAVVVVDTSGRLRFINPAAARLLGATASELLGQPWRHLAPLVAGDGDRRVPPGRPLRRRAREVEIGGERLRIETFTPDDPPPLVEHLGDGVNVVRAHDSAIVYVNPAFERLFGYDPGEILGRHVSVVNAPTERDPLAVADEITGHLRAHGSWRGEVLNVRKDGRAFPCWAVVTSFEHPTHGLAWLALHSDISARKEAEAALRRAAEAALAATRAKSAFLSRMSHEIRTPLSAVLGVTDLLADEPLSPRGRDYLRMLRGGGESLLALVGNILDLASLESGRITSRPRDLEIAGLIEEVVDLLAVLAAKKGLALRITTAPDLPRRAHADATHIRQILVNLVGNAIKFTRHGGVEVHAAADAFGRLVLRVSDTGPGIPAALHAALFDPYRKLSGPRIEGQGSGLGLAITRSFVEIMGGTIDFETGESGTSFTVVLPLARPRDAPTAAPPEAPRRAAIGARVLVAEDDPSSALILEAMLLHHGAAEVVLTRSGREALDAWRRTDFDLLLFDRQMPELSGIDAVRLLRAEAARAGRPRPTIAIISADAFDDDRRACLDAGCDDFLAKPLTPSGLHDLLTRLARLRTADHDHHDHGGDAGPDLDARPTQVAAST